MTKNNTTQNSSDETTSAGTELNEEVKKLEQVFPQFVKDGEVDFDALKVWLDNNATLANSDEKYGLGWAGKTESIQAIRRKAHTTLRPDKMHSKEWETTQNLFIEGDNLETLKLLLRHYGGTVKMIYIDPPYNTGKDFVYKDTFKEGVADFKLRTGQDVDGANYSTNSSSSGRYHSNWINMMFPRLFFAKQMLREDGVIFVSIDDHEVHNLRMIMDEIFGEENFGGQIIWEKKYTTSNNTKGISYTHEYILCYYRNVDEIDKALGRFKYTEIARARFKNPDNDPRGDWSDVSYHGPKSPTERPNLSYPLIHPITKEEIWPKEKSWAYEKTAYETHVEENRLYWGKAGSYAEPRLKIYLEEIKGGIIPKSIFNYEDFGTTAEGRSDLRDLFGKLDEGAIFDNPKPVQLITKLLEIGTSKDSLVLDFFSGSGTTAQAVMLQNALDGGTRKHIQVQLPEATPKKSGAFKAGYKTISEICRERIRRAGEKITQDYTDILNDRSEPLDTGYKSFILSSSSFLKWQPIDINDDQAQQKLLDQAKTSITSPLIADFNLTDVVYEIALKEGADLNDHVKELQHDNESIYLIEGASRKIYVTLAKKISQSFIDGLDITKEDYFFCLDTALNDSEKTNLTEQFNLKTI